MRSYLSDEQVRSFDRELMTAELWRPVQACIERDFWDGNFNFLDVGGGNGMFADRVLEFYPRSRATVLELNAAMAAKNRPHERKRVVVCDAMQLGATGERYDVIFCNWLLHHVVSNTYRETQRNIAAVLGACAGSLSERGRLSVYENAYNGHVDSAPSRLIFFLTATRALAPISRRLGANTAGTGVCFLSDRQWAQQFGERFSLLSRTRAPAWPMPWYVQVPLLLSVVQCVHYWLSPRRADGAARASSGLRSST